jgi:TM2 domain-containing membrane protein YozV
MPEIVYPQDSGEPIVVDLRDPYWAAFLAWIWPGAGHFYQRRFAKGFLFMICVLSTYFLGLGLGHGRESLDGFSTDYRKQREWIRRQNLQRRIYGAAGGSRQSYRNVAKLDSIWSSN